MCFLQENRIFLLPVGSLTQPVVPPAAKSGRLKKPLITPPSPQAVVTTKDEEAVATTTAPPAEETEAPAEVADGATEGTRNGVPIPHVPS